MSCLTELFPQLALFKKATSIPDVGSIHEFYVDFATLQVFTVFTVKYWQDSPDMGN